MTIDINIRNERLQYDTKRKAAKISALSSGKIDKNEYLMGEEILPFDQRRNIELSLYFSLGKALKRHTEAIQDQGRKQIDTLKVLEPNTQQLAIKDAIPEGQINEETKMKLRELNR